MEAKTRLELNLLRIKKVGLILDQAVDNFGMQKTKDHSGIKTACILANSVSKNAFSEIILSERIDVEKTRMSNVIGMGEQIKKKTLAL